MSERPRYTQHLPLAFGALAGLCLSGSLVLGFRQSLKKVNAQLMKEAKANAAPVVQYTARELLYSKPHGSDKSLWIMGAKALALGFVLAVAGTSSIVFIAAYSMGASNMTEFSQKLREKMPDAFKNLKSIIGEPLQGLHGSAAVTKLDEISSEISKSVRKSSSKEYTLTPKEQRDIDLITSFLGLASDSDPSTTEKGESSKPPRMQ
jgi:hypothetical protein